jgi:outer membrane protein assembly factor BamB
LKQQIQRRRPALLLFVFALILLTGCGGRLPAASWFGVAADDEVVYLAANEQVFALNLESGAELWSFPAEPDTETGPFFATPLLANETLVVGGFGDDGTLFAISPDRGMQTWTVKTEGKIVDGPVSVQGGIVVGNGEGEVYLVDQETLEKRLLLKANEPIWATPLVNEANTRVYVASMDHHLYAADLERGETLWAFEAGGAFAGTPALSDGVLYVGALNSTFYAIDAETGAELWHIETEGWVWGGPLVRGDSVYFGDMAGMLYALDTADGSERWTFEVEEGIRATPVLVDDVLYFGTRGGEVYAVGAADGTQEWMQSLEGSVYSQPLIRGDYLLVSPHNAKVQLVALAPESGAERWTYPPREE